ncbi:MAG: amidase [Deltaproteobacteria bacterium]|nr:amidase [Deltaproteobacteria bacterium]
MDKSQPVLSLMEALGGIKSRQFTSEEYTQSLLHRIALLDGKIQAWTWLKPEEALQAARRSDSYLHAGGAPGSLQGLPIGVKDIFATAGVPTEMGSPAFAGHVPKGSARVIERLETQGAFVMGKTVTTECAFFFPGKTRNPWNPLHTPGGSSSGSAAAVAAGFVPAALGTQTNGSVIRPAAFCGVVGFKPTQGAIPIEGALTFSHTLDQAGIFTRQVEDAAWLSASLAGESAGLLPAICARSTPPRLAAVKTPVWEQAEDYARQHFMDNIATLRKGGAQVDEVELPEIFSLAQQTIRTIMAAEAAFNLGELQLKQAPLLSPVLTDFLAEGRNVGAAVYLQALKIRQNLQNELERFLAKYDAAITPAATGEAPATLEQTGNPAFCSIWSLCGVPAITIPAGFGPRGLPLGLQIVGPQGKDDQVLSAAHWCEGLLSFPSWEEKQ